MTPAAHSTAGLLGWQLFSGKKNLESLIIFVLIANLPDIDFPLYLLLGEKIVGLHQYYTHNIFFVLVTALALWPFFRTRRERWGILLISCTHLFLDFFTIDVVPPIGFRLFYPFSQRLYNCGFFPNILKSSWSEVFSWHNLMVVGVETMLFTLPVILVYRKEFAGYFDNIKQSLKKRRLNEEIRERS